MVKFRIASLFLLSLVLALSTRSVLAHSTVVVGEYEIEVGWASEPPVVGQANQIVIDIQPQSGREAPEADIRGLTFTIRQGDAAQVLEVVSANEAPGAFEAAFTPPRAGQYTLAVAGTLNGESVEVAIDPEPVEPGTVAIPSVQLGEAPDAGPFPVIAIAAVVVAVVLGVAALVIRRRAN